MPNFFSRSFHVISVTDSYGSICPTEQSTAISGPDTSNICPTFISVCNGRFIAHAKAELPNRPPPVQCLPRGSASLATASEDVGGGGQGDVQGPRHV
jgi:hypothetical protein